METRELRKVVIQGLHDRQDLELQLMPGLNILYGKNGTGKTTFLHILANLLDRDISRFNYLRFHRIFVETADGSAIEIRPVESAEQPGVSVRINGEFSRPLHRGEQTPVELRAVLREMLGGRPVYLPAFRSVLEAISGGRSFSAASAAESLREAEVKQLIENEEEEAGEDIAARAYLQRERSRAIAQKTMLCRDWFGPFVPVVRFPSLREVSEELVNELQEAQLALAATDREAFSGVFVQVLRAVISPSEGERIGDVQGLLDRIRKNLTKLEDAQLGSPAVYSQITSMVRDATRYPSHEEKIATRILEVYDRALQQRTTAQTKAFEQIHTFESSVNRFLTGKHLTTAGALQPVRSHRRLRQAQVIRLPDGHRASLSVLSSGERHVLTMLFSATHMSATDGMLLIDEPELSLHVGWQRLILDELMKQAGSRQIIACTHAPEVAGRHREVMTRLSPTSSSAEQRAFDDPSFDFESHFE